MAHDRLSYLFTRPDIAPHGDLQSEYWHRPGEFLVHQQDIARIEDTFAGFEISELTPRLATEAAEQAAERTGLPPLAPEPAFEAASRRGFVRFRTSVRMNIPALVAHWRGRPAQTPEDPDVRVAPHHVLMGEQAYQGSPADEPVPALPGDYERRRGRAGSGVTVAVLDTGLAAHPALEGRVEPAGRGHEDVVDEDGDGLRDHQAGHGTFVAGRVAARAPGATVRAYRVLDSWGITDELTLAHCLDTLGDVDVVNLSLGGYSHDNTEPLALAAAIGGLPERTVLVAAAGNYGKSRPFWPAALKRCISVAALDADGEPAAFTNYGAWVDTCAPGAAVASTFLEHADEGAGPGEIFRGFARWSGTSFAAPHVAAAIAAEGGGGTDPRDAAYRLLRSSARHPRPGHGVVVA